MQKVESPKPKSKVCISIWNVIHTHQSAVDGISKFEKAAKLFQDIEHLIEQELANTPILAGKHVILFSMHALYHSFVCMI